MKLPSLGGEFMEADRGMDRQTARPDETTRFSQNFRKRFENQKNVNFHETSFIGSRVYGCGQTDGQTDSQT